MNDLGKLYPAIHDEDWDKLSEDGQSIIVPINHFNAIRQREEAHMKKIAELKEELTRSEGFSLMKRFQGVLKDRLLGVDFAEADGMVLRFTTPAADKPRRWRLTLEGDE